MNARDLIIERVDELLFATEYSAIADCQKQEIVDDVNLFRTKLFSRWDRITANRQKSFDSFIKRSRGKIATYSALTKTLPIGTTCYIFESYNDGIQATLATEHEMREYLDQYVDKIGEPILPEDRIYTVTRTQKGGWETIASFGDWWHMKVEN